MTETREQWIEREARKARERYWDEPSDWDRANEDIREDWRNVVASFYQEPVADADTLEKLVGVARKAAGEGYDTEYIVAAVLRAAKPEVNVTAREIEKIALEERIGERAAKIRDLVNSRIRYRFELPQPEPLRVPVDVEGLAKVLYETPDADGETWAWDKAISYEMETRRNEARAALAFLNIEPCDKPEYNPADVALTKPYAAINGNCPDVFRDCERWMAEGPGTKNIEAFLDKACDKEGRYNVQRLLYLIDRLADERRVQNDVAFRDALKKSQEIVNNWTPEQRNHNSIGYAGIQDNERAELENLRAECKRLRDEVVNLLGEISKTNSKAERQRQALDANRKTIESRGAEICKLENEVKRLRIQQSEWTDADVEELARAMRVGYANECHGCPPNTFDLAPFMVEARAALAWFDGKRGEV